MTGRHCVTWGRNSRFPLLPLPPSPGILCAQILFSLLDIGLAGATLFILLPDGTISYSAFIAVYAIALVLAVISSVPAGLGVFEARMATALHPYIPLEVLTAALVVYRIIYYFLPFLGGIFYLQAVKSICMFKSGDEIYGLICREVSI